MNLPVLPLPFTLPSARRSPLPETWRYDQAKPRESFTVDRIALSQACPSYEPLPVRLLK